MAAADIAAVFIALIRFAGAVYPDRLDAVDDVLAACQQARALVPFVTELPVKVCTTSQPVSGRARCDAALKRMHTGEATSWSMGPAGRPGAWQVLHAAPSCRRPHLAGEDKQVLAVCYKPKLAATTHEGL